MRILFFFILIFILLPELTAQKVGLVLSGGGAKGLAHVGVIKALEENNIPIDFITGTSMGAIVGGLYAMGYSPEQMEAFFFSAEFNSWAKGELSSDDLFFFKQKDDDPSWIELRFSSEDSIFKPVLPTNIIPPHHMNIAFMQICSPASAAARYNFDSLMIPFRCVATDVHDKKIRIFSKGDLAQAVRASMTFPLYFKPIEIDGHLMFDGGMLNNFPAGIMVEEFNPDIIIGVKVSDNALPPKANDLFSQVENMLTQNTSYDINRPGIVIEPYINYLGLLEFDKAEEAIMAGYKSTIEAMDSIKSMINRRITPEQLEEKRRAFESKVPALMFQSIHIHGLNSTQTEYIIRNISRKNEIFSFFQFKRSYYKLLSDDFIKSIYPEATYDTLTGFFDLHLNIEKDNKFMANFGGNISSSTTNEAFINSRFKFLSKRAYLLAANMYFGRFYNSGQLSGRIDFPAVYHGLKKTFFPFYIESYMTYNSWDYYRSSADFLYQDSRPAYLIQNETFFKTNLGFPIGYHGRISFGGCVGETNDKYYFTNAVHKEDIPDVTRFLMQTYHITLEHNSQKTKLSAPYGSYHKFQVRLVDGSEKYFPGTTSPLPESDWIGHSWWQFRFLIQHLYRIGQPFSLGGQIEGLYSTQPFYNNYISTLLSSPVYTPTPHSKTIFIEQFRAHKFLAGGINSVFSLSKNVDFRVEGYLFLPYQKFLIDEFQASYSIPLLHRYYLASATLIYNTLIGPASITANYYEKSGSRFYLSVNFGYLLFNKRITE